LVTEAHYLWPFQGNNYYWANLGHKFDRIIGHLWIEEDVEDEGSNLNIMITTLKSIVSCDVLDLENVF
jgi:hypothetical protein